MTASALPPQLLTIDQSRFMSVDPPMRLKPSLMHGRRREQSERRRAMSSNCKPTLQFMLQALPMTCRSTFLRGTRWLKWRRSPSCCKRASQTSIPVRISLLNLYQPELSLRAHFRVSCGSFDAPDATNSYAPRTVTDTPPTRSLRRHPLVNFSPPICSAPYRVSPFRNALFRKVFPLSGSAPFNGCSSYLRQAPQLVYRPRSERRRAVLDCASTRVLISGQQGGPCWRVCL